MSRLLRGRRGTEWATRLHREGDRFVMLTGDTVRVLDLPLAALGSEVRVLATGLGDEAGPVEARLVVSGASVVPPAPVLLPSDVRDDGEAVVRWVRRSRNGWRWLDMIDAPLAEEAESYRVTIADGDGTRSVSTSATEWTVPEEALAGRAVAVSVSQLGTLGESVASMVEVRGELA